MKKITGKYILCEGGHEPIVFILPSVRLQNISKENESHYCFTKNQCSITYKCLHTGHGNLDVNDLGVTISADMKVSEQCGIAASKGNQILGLIRRNITYKDKKLIIPLYKAVVRPHLEYCIQAWRPYRKKDTLKRIQRRGEVKLVKDQCRLDIRKYSFSQRIVNEWNKLSTDCITVSSMNMFKNKLDTYFRRVGYT